MSSPVTEASPARAVLLRLQAGGFRFLYVIDAVTLFASMHLITSVRFGFDWPTFSYSYYLAGFSLATLIHLSVYYFGGLYEYEQRLGRPPWLPKASVLTAVAVLVSAGVALGTGRYLMPRGNLVALFVVATIVVSVNRWLARRVRSRRFMAPRVLLVGAAPEISLAERHIDEIGGGARVVGRAPDTVNLLAIIDDRSVTDVLLLSGGSLDEIYPTPLDELERRLIGVYRRVLPVDTLLGLQRSREIAGMPFVTLRTHAVPTHRLRLKRLLDLLVLVVVAPVALLVFGVVALYVRVTVGRRTRERRSFVARGGSTHLGRAAESGRRVWGWIERVAHLQYRVHGARSGSTPASEADPVARAERSGPEPDEDFKRRAQRGLTRAIRGAAELLGY